MSGLITDAASWVLVGLLAAALAMLLWAALHPRSFRRGPLRRARSWWAHAAVYGPAWPSLARRHGLAATDRVPDERRPPRDRGSHSTQDRRRPTVELVRLTRVVRDRGVDHLALQLPAGVTPDDVRAACDSLSHALGAISCRVRSDRPGRVWLDVRRHDDLVRTVPPAPPAVPGSPDDVVALLAGVVVGRDEDGGPWRAAVRGSHTLIAGTTGSGKSSLLWALVCGLLPAVRAGYVRLTWLDPKGGMEADAARPVADVVDRVDQMADHLEQLVRDLDARADDIAGTARTHTPTAANPHHVVIIDELATITALAEAKTARRVEAALGALLSRGRAVGFTVITTTVDPGKDVVRWRGLHAVRVAFRLDEPIQVDMVLGEGARQRGARCDEIALHQAGVGYIRIDGHPEPVRVRAAYLDDSTIRARVEAATTAASTVSITSPVAVDLAAEADDQAGQDTPASDDGEEAA